MKTKTTLAILFLTTISFAQQDIMYSQYMFNPLVSNPALAAGSEFPAFSLTHRKQWVDFDGSPTTQAFTFNSLILRKNVGVGLVVENDKIGVTKQTNISGSYAYLLNLGFGNKLSFGVKGGISRYRSIYSDPSRFHVQDPEDPVFLADNQISVPNFGFGVYFKHKENFYSGISIPKLIDYRKFDKIDKIIADAPKEQQHYYLMSGLSVQAGEKIELKPSFLVKFVPAAPVQGDMNLNIVFSDFFLIGGSYRTGDAAVLLAGLQLDHRLRIGYSFDITVSNLRNYSSNTHELSLGYVIVKETIKMKTPRFF